MPSRTGAMPPPRCSITLGLGLGSSAQGSCVLLTHSGKRALKCDPHSWFLEAQPRAWHGDSAWPEEPLWPSRSLCAQSSPLLQLPAISSRVTHSSNPSPSALLFGVGKPLNNDFIIFPAH